MNFLFLMCITFFFFEIMEEHGFKKEMLHTKLPCENLLTEKIVITDYLTYRLHVLSF